MRRRTENVSSSFLAKPIVGRIHSKACFGRTSNVQVPAFDGQRIVDLPVPCSFDFNVAATKYFFGLEGGEVPLAFLFSGTVFYRDADGFLQMDLISWSKEANYRLPVRIWQELMDFYYPNTVWLRIDREVFERDLPLQAAKRVHRLG